jgi:uncharacterized protein YjlB
VAGCILAPPVFAGCNALVDLRDIEEAAPEAISADGGGSHADGGVSQGHDAPSDAPSPNPADADAADPADAANPADAADDDAGDAGLVDAGDAGETGQVDAGPTVLTGVLHFLQTPASVTVGSGSDTITLTANGAFELPVHTSSYDVVVTTQPSGQTCWVANGKGNSASPTAGLEVRCSVIKKSVGTATSDRSLTTTASYAHMDDVADVVFQNDIPAQTLLYLAVPAIDVNPPSALASQYRIAIAVDGQLHAETVTQVHFNPGYNPIFNHTPVLVLSTPTLPAGTHTIRAQWRRVDGSDAVIRPAVAPSQSPMKPELGAIVLDSLSTFDRLASTSTTTSATVPEFNMDSSIGVPQLSFTTTVAQPALLLANIPDLKGEHTTKLQVDGTTAAYQRFHHNDVSVPTSAPTPMVLRSVPAGTHTLDVLVNGHTSNANQKPTYGASAGANDVKRASLTALLWKAGTAFASWETTTEFDVVGPFPDGWKQGGQAINITTTKPSKALVMMDLSRVASATNPGENPTEVSIFVAGAQGPTVVVGRGGWGDWLRSNVCTRIGVVDLPAGTTAVDLRFRTYAQLPSHVFAARYGVVVLE